MIYKNLTFRVFTVPGLIFTIVLLILFAALNMVDFEPVVGFQLLYFNPITLVIAWATAMFTMSLWWILGVWLAPLVGTFLTENKIGNMIFTKGNQHYFEKVPESDLRIKPGLIIAKFINLLMSWLAVSAFLLGIVMNYVDNTWLADFFTANLFGSSPNYALYFVKVLLILVAAPILMTVVIPIPWMLLDVRLKAFHSGSKQVFLVGRAIQARLNPIFAVGGLVSLVMANLSVDLIVQLISFVIAFLCFPSVLIVTLYYMLFQVKYYESFLRRIPVPYGTTKVVMEVKFKKPEAEEKTAEEVEEEKVEGSPDEQSSEATPETEVTNAPETTETVRDDEETTDDT